MRDRVLAAAFLSALAFPATCLGQATRSGDLFSHPERLCAALQTMGIRTGPWSPIAQPPTRGARVPYGCEYQSAGETSPFSSLPGVRRAPQALLFGISGTGPARADSISLSVSVRDPSTRDQAKEQFVTAVRTLFEALGRTLPRGLSESIENERHYVYREGPDTLWFSLVRREDSREEVFWLQVRANGS